MILDKSYLKYYFTCRLHTWYQGTTQNGAFNEPSADGRRSRSQIKVKFPQKWVKNQRTGHISEAISLGTKVHPNKVHSMTQVPMTLTFGQGQRSRSNYPKNGLNNKQLAISWMLFHPQTSLYLLSIIYYHSFLWLIWALPSCSFFL